MALRKTGLVRPMEAVKLVVVGVCIYAVRGSREECPMLLWLTVLSQVLLLDVGTKVLADTCKAASRVTTRLLSLIHLVEMTWHFIGFYLLLSPHGHCSHTVETGALFALSTFSLSFLSAFLSQLWEWLAT